MVNPVNSAVNAFLHIWNALPLPLRAVFYVGLAFAFIWALFQILSK